MALKATKERYYQIPHGIVTVFVNGSQLGVGMVQANPANGSSHEPMFMHSNIIKWSMKNFLCKGDCKPLPGQKARFHLEDSKSEINRHLNEGIRIFATQQLFEKGIDPEPIMWKALEHTACRSVMGRPDMCQRARDHMQKTFGFRFEKTKLAKTKLAESVGYGEEICVIGP